MTTPEQLARATEQAKILAQALPFLRRYAGATIVVKYGGHAMGDPELATEFGKDIALLKQVGMNPVVVARRAARRSTPCSSDWRSNRSSLTACA